VDAGSSRVTGACVRRGGARATRHAGRLLLLLDHEDFHGPRVPALLVLDVVEGDDVPRDEFLELDALHLGVVEEELAVLDLDEAESLAPDQSMYRALHGPRPIWARIALL
jgi:hypothetical protein